MVGSKSGKGPVGIGAVASEGHFRSSNRGIRGIQSSWDSQDSWGTQGRRSPRRMDIHNRRNRSHILVEVLVTQDFA